MPTTAWAVASPPPCSSVRSPVSDRPSARAPSPTEALRTGRRRTDSRRLHSSARPSSRLRRRPARRRLRWRRRSPGVANRLHYDHPVPPVPHGAVAERAGRLLAVHVLQRRTRTSPSPSASRRGQRQADHPRVGKSPAVQTALNAATIDSRAVPPERRKQPRNSGAQLVVAAVFAKCMRSHGLARLPDPTGAGSIVGRDGAGAGHRRASAAVLHVVQVVPGVALAATAAKARELDCQRRPLTYASACSRSRCPRARRMRRGIEAAVGRRRLRPPSSQPRAAGAAELAEVRRTHAEPTASRTSRNRAPRLSVPGGQRSRPLVIRVQDSKREVRGVPASGGLAPAL